MVAGLVALVEVGLRTGLVGAVAVSAGLVVADTVSAGLVVAASAVGG